MAIFKKAGSRLIRQEDYEKLWIEPWGSDSLRVRATCQAGMPEEVWALTQEVEKHQAHIHIDGQTASITNGKLTAKIDKGGALSFCNAQGKLSCWKSNGAAARMASPPSARWRSWGAASSRLSAGIMSFSCGLSQTQGRRYLAWGNIRTDALTKWAL